MFIPHPLRRITWKSIILLVCLLMINSCNERERTNPFDPGSKIAEDPFSLEITSNLQEIRLDWNPVDSPDLTGYNIYRGTPGAALERFQTVPDSVTMYSDTSIVLHQTYFYGVTAFGHTDETSLEHLDTITPGPTRWWVLSDNFNSLAELSHDGLHLYRTYSEFSAPELVTAHPYENRVYVYDRFGGSMYVYPIGQSPVQIATGLFNGTALLSPANSTKLYLLRNTRTLSVINYQTGSQHQMQLPSVVTSGDEKNASSLWIAAGDTLYSLFDGNLNLSVEYFTGTGETIGAIAGAGDESVFIAVTESGHITRVQNGQIFDTITDIQTPVQLEYNSADSSLWFLSYDRDKEHYKVYQYNAGVTHLMLSGLKRVYDMEVNPVSDVCLVADYEQQTLYRIQPDGEVRTQKEFPGKVYQIVVQMLGSE